MQTNSEKKMKSPQTTIKNEKIPMVGLGFKVQNILVGDFEKARAISKYKMNGEVAFPKNEKNSQLESKAYSTPELAIFCTKINICLHSSTLVGGGK